MAIERRVLVDAVACLVPIARRLDRNLHHQRLVTQIAQCARGRRMDRPAQRAKLTRCNVLGRLVLVVGIEVFEDAPTGILTLDHLDLKPERGIMTISSFRDHIREQILLREMRP